MVYPQQPSREEPGIISMDPGLADLRHDGRIRRPLFQILRRRIVTSVDLIGQEALLVVGPELADIRVGLDHGVDELSAFALALADEDVADHVAIAVEADRATRRVDQ